MILDLRPYGMNWSIDSSKPDYIPKNPTFCNVVINGNVLNFKNNNTTLGQFTFNTLLGEGSYGKAYTVNEKIDGLEIVVKMISNFDKSLLINTVIEFIIQLLCVLETQDESFDGFDGPFVPRVYLFGMSRNTLFIISEKMDVTLEKHLKKDKSAGFVRSAIQQISKILDILQKKDRYNHRDFKADNVMIKYEGDKPCVKLIDFGMSCMEYDQIRLNSDPATLFHTCNIPSRDLSSLFYYFLMFVYSKADKVCDMYHIIRVLSSTNGYPTKWEDQYTFYNRTALNENLLPDNVYTVFKNLEIEDETNMCSQIHPFWVHSIKVLNRFVLSVLKDDELLELKNKVIENSLPLLSQQNKQRLLTIHPLSKEVLVRGVGSRNLLNSTRNRKNRKNSKNRKNRMNRKSRKMAA
jgi:hypothetical protein